MEARRDWDEEHCLSVHLFIIFSSAGVTAERLRCKTSLRLRDAHHDGARSLIGKNDTHLSGRGHAGSSPAVRTTLGMGYGEPRLRGDPGCNTDCEPLGDIIGGGYDVRLAAVMVAYN